VSAVDPYSVFAVAVDSWFSNSSIDGSWANKLSLEVFTISRSVLSSFGVDSDGVAEIMLSRILDVLG